MNEPAHQPFVRHIDVSRLFMQSPAMLCVTDINAHFQRVNPAFEKTLGYTETELLSRSLLDLVHPDDIEATLDDLHKLLQGSPSVNMENRIKHANGTYRWLLWNAAPLAEDGMLYATAIDITERERLDGDTRRLHGERKRFSSETEHRLQAMANRLLLAEEQERRRIARGLHDDVGQNLLAAKMTLQELEAKLSGEYAIVAGELVRLLDQAVHSTRSLTFDLASEALHDLGIGAAMQGLCERAERNSGISFRPPKSLTGEQLPESTRAVLYRAGRELIQNVVRHSGAHTARLSLTQDHDAVRLTVWDDGRGFDVAKQRACPSADCGFGLYSIEQQLRPIGARLEIDSRPGHGTRADVILPLTAAETRI